MTQHDYSPEYDVDAYLRALEVPDKCDKCGRARKRLVNTGTTEFPYWLCGTCQHREERRINTKEMYGRGRRGY